MVLGPNDPRAIRGPRVAVNVLQGEVVVFSVCIPVPAELDEDEREVYALNEAAAMGERMEIPALDVELANQSMLPK